MEMTTLTIKLRSGRTVDLTHPEAFDLWNELSDWFSDSDSTVDAIGEEYPETPEGEGMLFRAGDNAAKTFLASGPIVQAQEIAPTVERFLSGANWSSAIQSHTHLL